MATVCQVILQMNSSRCTLAFFVQVFTTEADLNALRSSLDNSCNKAEWTVFPIDKIIAACHQLKLDKKDADLVLNSLLLFMCLLNFFSIVLAYQRLYFA